MLEETPVTQKESEDILDDPSFSDKRCILKKASPDKDYWYLRLPMHEVMLFSGKELILIRALIEKNIGEIVGV